LHIDEGDSEQQMASRSNWIIERAEAAGRGGVVAAKHELGAEAGAAVLHRGGNAIDAAVTTAFVVGVVEPFMSGIGGGGLLVAHLPRRGESVVVDFTMVAPRRATPDMYRVIGGTDLGLFGWPAVEDNENIVGHRSVAVPGTVAGLALALERYGTISLAEALGPAIRYAEEGFQPTWHTSLMVAMDLANLNRFPATSAVFTVNGYPPLPMAGLGPLLRQPDLARTLRTIAEHGPRAFYEGPIADAIVADMQANGGLLDADDLGSYEARIVEPLCGSYRGIEVVATPAGTGGPTVLETLNLLEQADLRSLGHNSADALHQIAEASRQAFVDRFAYLADPDRVSVPVDALVSKAYAAERASEVRRDHARDDVRAGDRLRLGVTHSLASSEPGYAARLLTTTHISVIDREENAVSLTQTLLSGWGSRVTSPGTGILLNNGMMWFDPEAGRPNSVDGGKRPLANMAPVVLLRDGRSFVALGAMGGRRILNAIPQIVSNLVDHDMGIQDAIAAPRVDYSTRALQVSSRVAPGVLDELRRRGHPVDVRDENVFSFDFASPAGALVENGEFRGGATQFYPAMAIAVGE
jgi:gamma-glutamyltranspeptidase/glutathione hydrolase